MVKTPAQTPPPVDSKTLQWIMTLGGTMVGASASLVGLSKMVEASRGPSHVDELAGMTGALFALATFCAFMGIRAVGKPSFRRFELAADVLFGLGLFVMAAVGLLFAYDFI